MIVIHFYNARMQKKESSIFEKSIYYSYIVNANDFSLAPIVIGFERCRKNKGRIASNKTCYIFHYVLSGKGSVVLGGEETKIGEGSLFLLLPHSNAVYAPDKEDPWSYVWIEFSGPAAKTGLEGISFSESSFVFRDDEKGYLRSLFTKMIEEDNSSTELSEPWLLCAYLFKIFAFLTEKYPKEENLLLSKKEEAVKRIEEYLTLHCGDGDLSLGEVAERFSFSQSYITRLFKAETGITPIQFVDELRMKKAVELLSRHSLTIEQISEAIGYKNQFYFTKRFKMHYGVPPSKYKKKASSD